MFPLKRKCLDALYKTIAWVYIDARNLTCLDDEKTKTRYLKHHLGIRVASLPRDSDLAWMPTVNPKEMVKMFHRYNLFTGETDTPETCRAYHNFLNLACADGIMGFTFFRVVYILQFTNDNERYSFCLFMFWKIFNFIFRVNIILHLVEITVAGHIASLCSPSVNDIINLHNDE